MKTQSFTDRDLDNLIASIEQSLNKAEVLTKSKALKKDDQQQDDEMAPPAADAAPADAQAAPMDAQAAPAAEQAPEAAPMDAQAAPAAEQAPEAAPAEGGEQALEGEGQEDAPLSDEELQEIYGGMAPEELERHFMMIRQMLQSQQGPDAGAEQAPAPEAAQAAAPAMAKEEKEECDEDDKDDKKEDMEKSEERNEISVLKKKLEEQTKSIDLLGKAFEALSKPQRKSVTDLEYIKKSEIEDVKAGKELNKDEIREMYGKINPGTLSKSDRATVNNYFLNGEQKSEVEKIIQSKGGK